MPKRNWNKWPRDFTSDFNSMGGVVGGGGILLSCAGAILAAPIVFGLGVTLVGGAVTLAAYRTFPSKLIDLDSAVGNRYSSITDLQRFSEKIYRVGIIGTSESGKSTLVEKLMRNAAAPDPTADIYIVILRSGGPNPKIFALIDGAGEEYAQQFLVAQASDLVFLVVDHNEGRSEATVKQSRIEDHNKFVDQFVSFFRGQKTVSNLIILLNKQDNWKRSTKADDFREWSEDMKLKLATAVPNAQISMRAHENWDADCINQFWSEVETFSR